MNNQKVIIIGASSGIGRALARVFSRHGHHVGLCARRVELLNDLSKDLLQPVWIEFMDISKPEDAVSIFENLIEKMNGVDMVVLNAGVGSDHSIQNWEREKHLIAVNVAGFSALAYTAMDYFTKKGRGHIVGISSFAALRGGPTSHAYGASKAYMSNYLEGLRLRALMAGLPITITDIKPGFVKTDLLKDKPVFWVASAEKAAQQIFNAVIRKRKHAYITRRWRLIAWILKISPSWLVVLKNKIKYAINNR